MGRMLAEAARMKPDTISGIRPVAALFARRPDDVQRLFYLPAMREVAGPFCAMLAASRKPYRMVEAAELEKVAGTPHHGGIAAVAKARVPVILDLGAIARSAAFFGIGALLIGEGIGHAMVSDAALRTSEGGLEHLELYRTRDLPRALSAMEPLYRTVAATLTRDAVSLSELPRDRPVALVLGNEETGVSQKVLDVCRRQVRVHGEGRVQSLNVAQAAAVLLHDLMR